MMRTTILAFSLSLAVATSAQAEYTAKEQQLCETIAESAKALMGARQRGVALSKIMGIARKEGAPTYLEPMVADAYKVPRYSSGPTRRKAVARFRDDWYLQCYNAFSATAKE